jgi:hypothetical protein
VNRIYRCSFNELEQKTSPSKTVDQQSVCFPKRSDLAGIKPPGQIKLPELSPIEEVKDKGEMSRKACVIQLL